MPSFTFDLSDVTKAALDLASVRREFLAGVGADMEDLGSQSVALIQRKFRGGPAPSNKADWLYNPNRTRTRVRTGALWRSYAHLVTESPDNVTLAVGAIQPVGGEIPMHARIHEGYNASGQQVGQFVIKPIRGKYLRIPYGEGLTAAGVARARNWRDYADTFLMTTRRGNLGVWTRGPLLARDARRKKVKPTLIAILKRSVTVRPRPSLPTVEKKMIPALEKSGVGAFERAVRGV
jgi:hypothetical protein